MTLTPSEAQTRRTLIDAALQKAEWDITRTDIVGQEIPVDGTDPAAWQALQAELRVLSQRGERYDAGQLPAGISDYVLYQPNGEILAVVEAKRQSVNALVAETQARFYAEQIERRQTFRPFVFLTNGYRIYFWDVGRGNKREVAGFFTREELQNRLRQRLSGKPLAGAPINRKITDRLYQAEAIRRVGEAFDQGRRKALLVMATGTGKTRTVMSLNDLFLRTQQAQRVLFVADRDALVKQAIGEGFQQHLPDEPCVRIFGQKLEAASTQRLYAATLQTLSNCYDRFSPAFFDLIIFDEVHRSIFNKWNEVLQYFDARMVGLTATPADFIDRNTFLQFECIDGTPTFLYTYAEAIRDGFLVDFELYIAKTRFQRKGIRGVDLSEEERNLLLEQGIEPDAIDYAGTEIEKTVSNRDTLRRQWEEFMEVALRDQSGMLPGKTIVFAMTQEHAFRLQALFEEMYPQHPGLAQVITHTTDYKSQAIERFKQEEMPRIAISVDMLDTGVNVPEVVNLVFMKPVQSQIKLHQMIGRGTRNQAACTFPQWLPEGQKAKFLVVDFWENDFNRAADAETATSLPVLVGLFNTRLDLLACCLDDPQGEEAQQWIAALRELIAQIPRDAYPVRRLLAEVEPAWEDGFWRRLTQDSLDFLRLKVGPLLRHVPLNDVDAATFTGKVERLQLQLATGRNIAATLASLQEDVSRLPNFVFEDALSAPLARRVLAGDLAAATVDELREVARVLAPQMKNRRDRVNNLVVLDLQDLVETRGYIILTRRNEKVYVEEYRRRVENRILDLVAGHPTIAAIERGQPVSDAQLLDLERTLRRELGDGDLELSESNVRKAYGFQVDSLLAFLRQLLDLDGLPDYAEIVQRQFDVYAATNAFTGDQLRFLRAVQNRILQRRRLALPELYDSPFTSFGQDAVERLFTRPQIDGILGLAARLMVENDSGFR